MSQNTIQDIDTDEIFFDEKNPRLPTINAGRMISGLLWKPLNGFGLFIPGRYDSVLLRSKQFFLTKPSGELCALACPITETA